MRTISPRTQSSWEETNDEYMKRRDLANASKSSWIGTIVGLVIALFALVVLLVVR